MATTPLPPAVPSLEPFVVEVLSNHSENSTRRKLIFDPDAPSSFAGRAWEALHGTSSAAPASIVLAYEDGDELKLEDSADMQVLAVLASNTLRASGRCLRLRVKSEAEAWATDDPTPSAAPIAPATRLEPPRRARSVSETVFPVQRGATANTTSREVIAEEPGSSQANAEALPNGTKSTAVAAILASADAVPVGNGHNPAGDPADSVFLGQSVTDVPSFLDEEEYARQLDPTDPNAKSDCLWWLLATHPVAQAAEILTMVVIIISVFGFVFETLPQYRLDENGEERDHPVFFAIESACIAWFTVEYLMRLYAAGPGRFRTWMWKTLNVIDLIAILPYYITFAIGSSGASSIAVIRILRLTRVARLLKFSRHSSGLQDMIYCITHTQKELALFFVITLVASILFGSAVYYCEQDADSGYISIPESMWYSIITMTTVGYGDISPVTPQGKVVGALNATIGVVLLAIPAGVFISEFIRLHEERALSKSKLLRHEVLLEKVRSKLQEANQAVEVYHYGREVHTQRLKEHYKRLLDESHAKLEANTTDSQKGTLARGRANTSETYDGERYHVNVDLLTLEQNTRGAGMMGVATTLS